MWTYIDSLSTNDSTFTRPENNGTLFYYKTIRLSIFESGTYTLVVNGVTKIYGALYNNTFNPSNTIDYIIASNYNASDTDEFTINVWLQPNDIYIFVVSSDTSSDIGNFSIIATGPSELYFNSLTPTTSKYIDI